MTCPVCDGEAKIVNTKKRCDHVLRYRKCVECGYRFPTMEIDEDIFNRKTNSDLKIKNFVTALREIIGKLSDLGDKYD